MYVSFCFTVTVQLALFPLLLVAVITAVPAFFAVTFPALSIDATAVLLLLHFTVLSNVVLEGLIVAVNVALSPSVNDIVSLLTCILSIGTLVSASLALDVNAFIQKLLGEYLYTFPSL